MNLYGFVSNSSIESFDKLGKLKWIHRRLDERLFDFRKQYPYILGETLDELHRGPVTSTAFTIPFLNVKAECNCVDSNMRYRLTEVTVTFGAVIYYDSRGYDTDDQSRWVRACEYDHVADYRKWEFNVGIDEAQEAEMSFGETVFFNKSVCEFNVSKSVRKRLRDSLQVARDDSKKKYDGKGGLHDWNSPNRREIPDEVYPPANIVPEEELR